MVGAPQNTRTVHPLIPDALPLLRNLRLDTQSYHGRPDPTRPDLMPAASPDIAGPSSGAHWDNIQQISPIVQPPIPPSPNVGQEFIRIEKWRLLGILDKLNQLEARTAAISIRRQEAVARSTETVAAFNELADLTVKTQRIPFPVKRDPKNPLLVPRPEPNPSPHIDSPPHISIVEPSDVEDVQGTPVSDEHGT